MSDYTISPSNFRIVREQVAQQLVLHVGQGLPGTKKGREVSAGIILCPTASALAPEPDFPIYIQMGLSLPAGVFEGYSIYYECTGNSRITMIRVLKTKPGYPSGFLFDHRTEYTGLGKISAVVDKPFTDSLDMLLHVEFSSLEETIMLGALTISIR